MNLKELARELNVSPSTVSKAFRNSYDISPETRDRILAKAAELNYQPNPSASSLRTQKTRTIAVILPEIANNFFTLAINGIEAVAQKQGYHVLIYITHEDTQKEINFTNSLQGGRVDGVLVSLSQGTTDFSHFAGLQKKGIPVVYFDRVLEDEKAIKVTTNDFESGYLAAEHLIRQGCKKIAHLYFYEHLSISEKRRSGYIKALADNNYKVDESLVLECTGDRQADHELIKKLLKKKNRPDGIFSSIEKLALVAYETCNELNINIPRDVKIISFSNLPTASLLKPSLSTITQPAYEMGETAARMLFNLLTKRPDRYPPETLTLRSELEPRESTR
jgi:LacI family transcriptional regulator